MRTAEVCQEQKTNVEISLDDSWRVELHRFEITGNPDERFAVLLLGRCIHGDETFTATLQSKVSTKAGVFGCGQRFTTCYRGDAAQPVPESSQSGVIWRGICADLGLRNALKHLQNYAKVTQPCERRPSCFLNP